MKITPLKSIERDRRIRDAVAKRAFQICLSRGCGSGHQLEDWRRAGSEVMRPLNCGYLVDDDQIELSTDAASFGEGEVEICVEPRRLMICGKEQIFKPGRLREKIGPRVNRKGFGVLHTHDVAATLAAKGFQREPLKIIEVCNARYANQALEKDGRLALMLPCPISVYTERGKIVISTFRPSAIPGFFSLGKLFVAEYAHRTRHQEPSYPRTLSNPGMVRNDGAAVEKANGTKTDLCVLPCCASSETIELRPKLTEKAETAPVSSRFVKKRHGDLPVILRRYLSYRLHAIDFAWEVR